MWSPCMTQGRFGGVNTTYTLPQRLPTPGSSDSHVMTEDSSSSLEPLFQLPSGARLARCQHGQTEIFLLLYVSAGCLVGLQHQKWLLCTQLRGKRAYIDLIASCIRKVSTCHLSSTICSNPSRLVAYDWSSRIQRV